MIFTISESDSSVSVTMNNRSYEPFSAPVRVQENSLSVSDAPTGSPTAENVKEIGGTKDELQNLLRLNRLVADRVHNWRMVHHRRLAASIARTGYQRRISKCGITGPPRSVRVLQLLSVGEPVLIGISRCQRSAPPDVPGNTHGSQKICCSIPWAFDGQPKWRSNIAANIDGTV